MEMITVARFAHHMHAGYLKRATHVDGIIHTAIHKAIALYWRGTRLNDGTHVGKGDKWSGVVTEVSDTRDVFLYGDDGAIVTIYTIRIGLRPFMCDKYEVMCIGDVVRGERGLVLRPLWKSGYQISLFSRRRGKRIHLTAHENMLMPRQPLPHLNLGYIRMMGRRGEIKSTTHYLFPSNHLSVCTPTSGAMRRMKYDGQCNAIITEESSIDPIITWMADGGYYAPVISKMDQHVSVLSVYEVKVHIGTLRCLAASFNGNRADGTTTVDLMAYLKWVRAGTTPSSVRVVENGYLARRILEGDGGVRAH
jgi:hypothetical protein